MAGCSTITNAMEWNGIWCLTDTAKLSIAERETQTHRHSHNRRQEHQRATDMRAYKLPSLPYQSYPMACGDSSHNYAQNSWYQKHGANAANEIMNQAIIDVLPDFNIIPSFANNSFGTYRIADFGCSIGPNAFMAAENITESLEKKFQAQVQGHQSLEFHVFFSDHISNDFNTLFKTLPTSHKYFAAGVPGTLPGAPDETPFSETNLCMIYDAVGSCLQDLAKSGTIGEKLVEDFYLPIYRPRAKGDGGSNTHKWLFRHCLPPCHFLTVDESVTSLLRAIAQELFQQHFGIGNG